MEEGRGKGEGRERSWGSKRMGRNPTGKTDLISGRDCRRYSEDHKSDVGMNSADAARAANPRHCAAESADARTGSRAEQKGDRLKGNVYEQEKGAGSAA